MAEPSTGAALMTAAFTAFFGVIVYAGGQAAQRFVLEPVQEQRKVIGEIAFALLMHGNVNDVAAIRAQGHPVLELTDPLEVARTIRHWRGVCSKACT
jgi:hypothetical protein